MGAKRTIRKLVLKGLLAILLISLVGVSFLEGTEKPNATNSFNGEIVYAQQTPITAQQCINTLKGDPKVSNEKIDSGIQLIAETLIMVEKALFGLNIPVVLLIGKLLSNDWVFLDQGVRNTLQTLWVLVRNFVNIIFVVVLIIIAFMTVAGVGGDKSTYAIKTILPKFIFALIFVNFSFLICKVVLDMGNLATTAAFSIVQEVGPNVLGIDPNNEAALNKNFLCYCSTAENGAVDEEFCKDPGEKRLCIGDTLYLGLGSGPAVQNMCKDVYPIQEGIQNPLVQRELLIGWSKEPAKFQIFTARTAMFIYAFNIFHLPELGDIYRKGSPSEINTLAGVTVNLIVSVVFAGLLMLLNIGMLVAFAIRMVLIWLYMILSPVMALEIVFPDKIKGKIPGIKSTSFINGFISLSFMPAICGFILSLGFLMYHLLKSSDFVKNISIPLGPITVITSGAILPGFQNIQELILALMIMIIIWTSVFAMLKSNDIVGAGSEKIKAFGKQLKDIGAKGLTMIPILPTPYGLKSTAAMKEGLKITERSTDTKVREQALESLSDLPGIGPIARREMSSLPSDAGTALKRLAEKSPTSLDRSDYQKAFELVGEFGTMFKNNEIARKDFAQFLKNTGLKDENKLFERLERGEAGAERDLLSAMQKDEKWKQYVGAEEMYKTTLSREGGTTSSSEGGTSSPEHQTSTEEERKVRVSRTTLPKATASGVDITLQNRTVLKVNVAEDVRLKATEESADGTKAKDKVREAVKKALDKEKLTNLTEVQVEDILDATLGARPEESH